MPSPEFQPGCRLSSLDVVVLIVAGIIVAAVSPFHLWFALVVGFVVGHFYLFCNVFRLSRLPELVWAAIFLGLSSGTLLADWPGWTWTFLLSAIASTVLIALETRQPHYHGLWWEALNPGLPQWWDARHGHAAETDPTKSA